MEEPKKQVPVADLDLFAPEVREARVGDRKYFVHELDMASDAIGPGTDGILHLVTLSVRREDGTCVWSAKDIPELRKFSRVKFDDLLKVVLEVNGFNIKVNDEK